jgi:cytochrome b6-f complex iron-sulfur subunit
VRCSRREFLRVLEAGLVCGAVPAALAGCARFQFVNSGVEGGRLVVSRAEFGEGPFALIEAPNLPMPIYLYRHAGGHFTAVLTRCMHRGCQVEAAADHLVCPCHGSEYDNAGRVLKGPTQLPLIRFPVETDAENIYVELQALDGESAA